MIYYGAYVPEFRVTRDYSIILYKGGDYMVFVNDGTIHGPFSTLEDALKTVADSMRSDLEKKP